MIEKLFRRMLIKRFIAEQANNYDSTENSRAMVRIFYRTLGLWFGIGILLSYMAYEYGLDSRQCNLCNQLANTFPSIDIATAKSDYPNVMRIIWLYFTVTTPLSFLSFFLMMPYWDFRNANLGCLWFIYAPVLFGIFICLGIYFFLNGGTMGSGLTRWDRLFMHSIIGAFTLCFSCSFSISFNLFFLTLVPIYYFNR